MKKTIPMAPNMDQEAADEALTRRNHADYQCYIALARHLQALAETRGIKDEIILELRAVKLKREEANDDFLKAVAGVAP